MKIRITNNSTVELDDVSAVFRTRDGFRLVFKDGAARQYRRVQLTPEGREAVESMVTE